MNTKGFLNKLQSRIFIAMLLLIFTISGLIILVAVYQYQEQAEDYHLNRLDRKENAVKRDIEYHLQNTTFFQQTDKLPVIFRDKIFEMSHVHNLEIGLYDLKGNLLISSRATFDIDSLSKPVSNDVLTELKNDVNHRVVRNRLLDNQNYLSIYSYIYDNNFTPIGILNIPYLGESDFYQKELEELLYRISFVFLFALLFAILLAYYSSKRISNPINDIVMRMKQTRINRKNEKIEPKGNTEEVKELIEAYNNMVDDLEESAQKLAKSERESAWREMAKQVAHEIKNPLTPMRLTIQNFERKYNPNDADNVMKIKDFSDSLIVQIDTMSAIANAFSDFAKMPATKIEKINVLEIIEDAVRVYQNENIILEHQPADYYTHFDKSQLIRLANNLINNAVYATQNKSNPLIKLQLSTDENNIFLTVLDNGIGIAPEIQDKIFEPKFTTKSSGMGLGLAMVKSILETYGGKISYTSQVDEGANFRVSIPKS